MNSSSNTIQIIPKPSSVTAEEGRLDLNSITAIALKHNTESEKFIAQLFQNFLEPVRWIDLSRLDETESGQIIIDLDPEHPMPHEGYNLSIGSDTIERFSDE